LNTSHDPVIVFGHTGKSNDQSFCLLPRLNSRAAHRQPDSRNRCSWFEVKQQRSIAETVSGSVAASERKDFKVLLNKLEAGDVLVVTKLDRLGRNAMDVRATVEKLTGLGVRIHFLALGGVDLTSPAGKMTTGVIAAVAKFERDLLIERTRAGMSRAKSGGEMLG
jgi:putative DNA-invertase from lambdoid prophage Rac